jgi:hypothetical protein
MIIYKKCLVFISTFVTAASLVSCGESEVKRVEEFKLSQEQQKWKVYELNETPESTCLPFLVKSHAFRFVQSSIQNKTEFEPKLKTKESILEWEWQVTIENYSNVYYYLTVEYSLLAADNSVVCSTIYSAKELVQVGDTVTIQNHSTLSYYELERVSSGKCALIPAYPLTMSFIWLKCDTIVNGWFSADYDSRINKLFVSPQKFAKR